MKPLEIEIVEKSEKKISLILTGSINEASDYSKVDLSLYDEISMDLSMIDLINSTGIQNWIQFLQKAPDKAKIEFQKCAIRVINQLNQFPSFTASKSIIFKSFFAPYYCEECDRPIEILLDCQEHRKSLNLGKAPRISYNCAKNPDLEFDSLEKKYFKFCKGNLE